MPRKILCVEDSRIMQNIYKRMVQKADFADEIMSLHTVGEAMDYYHSQLDRPSANRDSPELVFLDLNLPGMSGMEFLKEFENFQHEFTETKIVILTSAMDPAEKEKAMQYPFVLDYLPKPLTFPMLHDLTEKLP